MKFVHLKGTKMTNLNMSDWKMSKVTFDNEFSLITLDKDAKI